MTANVLSPLSYIKHVPCSAGATIVICRQCRQTGRTMQTGYELASVVTSAASGTGISVCSVACLGNCQKSLNATLMAPDSWSYVFQKLQITDAPDLVQAATSLSFAEDGQVAWNQWPAPLKKNLIAQIPAWNML